MSTPELTTYQYGGLRIMGVETQVIEDLLISVNWVLAVMREGEVEPVQ